MSVRPLGDSGRNLSLADPRTLQHRAAAYVRMSAEHQQYSTCNQLDVIREYSRRRNLELEKVYADEGKSGLRIKGRESLTQMIRDVLAKDVNLAHILVYDVSRWGRFQDPDEAAHYEFICRQAGVAVHYCAEQFENDGGLASTIAKTSGRWRGNTAGNYPPRYSRVPAAWRAWVICSVVPPHMVCGGWSWIRTASAKSR